MKKFIIISLSILFLSSITFSCAPMHNGASYKKTPPGQAKKAYGTKSAKPFAPGQRKK